MKPFDSSHPPFADSADLAVHRGETVPTLCIEEIARLMDIAMNEVRSILSPSSRVRLLWNRSVTFDLPIAVHMDSEDLKAVITSLIEHAVESMGGGEGVVRLGLQPGLRQVRLTVEDNGRGMANEILMRFQNGGSRASTGSSGGLTFKQARSLIEFWGGRAERQARLGVGSRVTLELPRVDVFASPFLVSRGRVDEKSAHAMRAN